MIDDAHIDQTEEHRTGNAKVADSTLAMGSVAAPPRIRPPDTFTAEGNLIWIDWGN
jgi:hypothetical protein